MTIYLDQRSTDRSMIGCEIMYARTEDGDWYKAYLKDCTNDGLSYLKEMEVSLCL